MLLSVFRRQALSEPSSGFPAAGVAPWEASSGACFPWCPPGDCIPLSLTHIFSGLGVNLQARLATLGNLPEPLGQPGTLGLRLDAASRILPSRSSACVNPALGTGGSWVHSV